MEPIVRAGVAGKKAGGISGGGLKIIAVICMFIDHMGAVLLFPELVRTGAPFSLNLSAIYESFFRPFDLYALYLISRFFGALIFSAVLFSPGRGISSHQKCCTLCRQAFSVCAAFRNSV